MASEKPKKLQRISQACDLCHRRSIRCRPSAENAQQQCQNCFDFGVNCTYNRPSRRRRNPSLAHTSPPNVLPLQQASVVSPTSDNGRDDESNGAQLNGTGAHGGHPDFTGAYTAVREGRRDETLEVAWRAFALASMDTIEQYMAVFMEMVYPIFPLFHGPTLQERLHKRDHITDRGFFASVMAACALAAARVRDGAISDRHRFAESPEKSSEIFFAAAQDGIGKDLSKAQGLGCMRACGLLAVTSIQYGQIKTMHQYLGMYMTLRAMQQCHDERHWPTDISIVEREERRRLYWSMYVFDIYTGVVFDGLMWSQETHSNVRYPMEVNDEDFTKEPNSPHDDENWLRGWNFTTDLYRMLEHSVKRMRRNTELHIDRISVTPLLVPDDMPDAQVMDNVLGQYYQLPARFRNFNVPVTGDKRQDLFGFQAANIQTTLQLVRMTLFSTNLNHDVYQKCYVAEQVLTTFHSIAPQYLRAISTPLVYHLGRIGRILASVMEGLLCEQSYQRVRSLLVSMADLLQAPESGLQPTAGASRDLRSQVEKIDRYMHDQQQLISSVAQQAPGLPAVDNRPGVMFALSHAQTPAMTAMGMTTPLDEFQLPPDLVNDGVWPWPFEFGQDAQISVTPGFET